MMALFLFKGFIQQRNAGRQLRAQLCDHWFQGALQTYFHLCHCRISSWAFLLLRCACNIARMESAFYYAEKKVGGEEEK